MGDLEFVLGKSSDPGKNWVFRHPGGITISDDSERIEELEERVKELEKKVRDLDWVKKATEAGENYGLEKR
jgi:hypothetical protein